MNLAIAHPLISWELWWMAPDSFDSCLGHCLEYTGHAVSALTKSLYFKSNLESLAICHPTQAFRWPLSPCTQSAVSAEGPVAGVPTELPRRCQCLMSLEWEAVKVASALTGEPKCLSTYFSPQGIIHDHSSLGFSLSKPEE